MPKVLLLTYHFPPSAASGAFRLLGFAQHLPRFGWNTIVVAPPSLPWEPVDPALAARVPAETIVHHVPYPIHLPFALRYLIPYALLLPYMRAAAQRAVVRRRPDLVLTSGPPHELHLIGRFVQKQYRIPWVADFRDPWVTTEGFTGASHWKTHWELYWERQVMRHADAVIANAPRAGALFQSAYPASAGKVMVLTNGYDPEVFSPAPAREGEAPAERGKCGPIRILHAGQLYAGRDPRPLLDAVQGVPAGSAPPFRIEFLGRILYEKGADLPGEARRRGIESSILCLGQMGYEQTLSEMCQADILLLMDSPGRKVGVPAKLYEYLGAGRPILAVAEEDGDLAAILRESGAPHRIVPCGDPVRIRQGMIELINGVASGQLGAATPEQRRRFSRQTLAGRLAATLDEMLVKRIESVQISGPGRRSNRR